jgi:hypothetical protein
MFAMGLAEVRRRLHELGDPADAEFVQRFLKTGPGEYGDEHDLIHKMWGRRERGRVRARGAKMARGSRT